MYSVSEGTVIHSKAPTLNENYRNENAKYHYRNSDTASGYFKKICGAVSGRNIVYGKPNESSAGEHCHGKNDDISYSVGNCEKRRADKFFECGKHIEKQSYAFVFSLRKGKVKFCVAEQKCRHNKQPNSKRAKSYVNRLRVEIKKVESFIIKGIHTAENHQKYGFRKIYRKVGKSDYHNGRDCSASAKTHCAFCVIFYYSKKFHSRSSSES